MLTLIQVVQNSKIGIVNSSNSYIINTEIYYHKEK
jgi:hypothetical protein